MCELGWKSLGVLELTALPSIVKEHWISWVREADVLLVNGGDALYLGHWMRQSGLADLLPSLEEKVWVGLSGGSMVMTPRIGKDFMRLEAARRERPSARASSTSRSSRTSITRTCRRTPWPTPISGPPRYRVRPTRSTMTPPSSVVDGQVDVISEGHWKLFNA